MPIFYPWAVLDLSVLLHWTAWGRSFPPFCENATHSSHQRQTISAMKTYTGPVSDLTFPLRVAHDSQISGRSTVLSFLITCSHLADILSSGGMDRLSWWGSFCLQPFPVMSCSHQQHVKKLCMGLHTIDLLPRQGFPLALMRFLLHFSATLNLFFYPRRNYLHGAI